MVKWPPGVYGARHWPSPHAIVGQACFRFVQDTTGRRDLDDSMSHPRT